jgi:pimeloyl-ACP methyl ester carboxylesterase
MTRKTKKRLLLTTLFLASLYATLLIISFATHLPDQLIVSPHTGPHDAPGATQLLLPFQNGQLEIFTARSQAAKSQGPKAYVLLFVGNEDRADKYPGPLAAAYADKPIEFWAVNYPGFGNSTGPAHLNRFGPAALLAYDTLAQKAGGKPIVVRGASLGTLGALCVAANRPVAALHLHNPLALPHLIRGKFGWWNLYLLAGPISLSIPDNINGVKNARRATAPCTFVLAENDEVIPPPYQQLIVNAYAGKKQIVTLTRGTHNSRFDETAKKQLELIDIAIWNSLLTP